MRPPRPQLGSASHPALIALAISIMIAGCGSSSSSSAPLGQGSGSKSTTGSPAGGATAGTPGAGGVNPNQRETLPPGDIPDAIAYVPFPLPGAGLTVSAPEGWSRSSAHGAVSFTDKLNQIQVFTVPAHQALTAAVAQRSEVPKLAATVRAFKLQSITTVTRPAGPAIRIAYLGDSAPSPVTGKMGTLAFERYYFAARGREVVLLLSSPQGSDNVDPWRKVTSSLRITTR